MGIFKPPTPVQISSGSGGSGGSTINNGSSAITVNNNTSTGDTSISITTNNVVAVKVDNNQNVVIGNSSISSTKRLVVSDPIGDCVQLINESDNASASLTVDSGGGLSIATSGSIIQLGSNDVYLDSGSLYIDGVPTISSADQLNYVATTPGIAVAMKALVVDAALSICNINSLSAVELLGTLSTGAQPNITSLSNVDIDSLSLGGLQIASTATEINYLHGLTGGIAMGSKALVVDSNLSISDINNISASTISGTLQSPIQPNITSIGTLSSLNVSGSVGIGTNTPSRTLDIVSLSPTIRLSDGTNSAEFSVSPSGNLSISSAGNIIISNYSDMVFGGDSSILGIGNVEATTLTGMLQTAYQPNITTIGSLTNLNVSGDVSFGSLSATSDSQRVTIYEPNGICLSLVRSSSLLCNLTINSFGDIELTPTRNIRITSGKALQMAGPIIGVTDLSANTLTGVIQTADQPNITSIGILSSLNVTNGVSASSVVASTLSGILQTSSQPNITSIGILSSLTVTNGVSASSVLASTLTGTLQTTSQPNITTIGTLSSLDVINGITASYLTASTFTGTLLTASQPNITTIGTLSNLSVTNGITATSLAASTLTGTIQTASQTNITAIGTLSSLNVTNGITSSSMTASIIAGTLQTAFQPNITAIGTLSNLTVTNGVSATSITASSLTGIIQTSSQPNITSIGALTKLVTSGPLGIGVSVPSCAIEINTSSILVDPTIKLSDGTINSSIGINSTGLVIDTSGQNITLGSGVNLRFDGGLLMGLSGLIAETLTGTLLTAAQPNVTSVGTLSYLDSGFLGLGTPHAADYRLSILDPEGEIAFISDGTNSLAFIVNNGDFTFIASNQRLALGSSVSLVLNGGTIIGLNDLTATTISGIINTADQPNITSIGTLSSLSVSGIVNAGSATIGSAHITGDVIIDGSLSLSTPLSFDNLMSSTGQFNADIDATSSTIGGTLTVKGGAAFSKSVFIGTTLNVGGALLTSIAINKISGATDGIVSANKFISADANCNLTGFNCLSSTNLVGTIKTAYQPYITTVGNLTNLNVNGYLGVGNTSPIKQLEINSTTGDCLRLSYNKPTNNAYMDILVDASGNASMAANGGTITVGSKLITQQMVLGNTTSSVMPLEVGYVPFVMTAAYAYNSSANAKGLIAAGGTTSYNYSIRASGRILCTQSLDVTSDRRVKKNIMNLTDEFCTSFIENTTPVKFNWKDGDGHKSYGYIAQELMKEGFTDIVNLVDADDMEEEIDDDGLISPAGAKYTVSYEYVIPILAKNQKRLMRENAELKAKLDAILGMLQNR